MLAHRADVGQRHWTRAQSYLVANRQELQERGRSLRAQKTSEISALVMRRTFLNSQSEALLFQRFRTPQLMM
jgi:hypothetical protein